MALIEDIWVTKITTVRKRFDNTLKKKKNIESLGVREGRNDS